MPRNILGNKDFFRTEPDSDRKEFKPPEEKLVDSEHYINERDSGKLDLWMRDDFESLAQDLESIVKNARDKVNTQIFIDILTAKLRYESDIRYFSRTEYLTGVVQAFNNISCGNEFVIDIRDWPEDEYYVGWYLKGRDNELLTLNVYGDFEYCVYQAENCNFIIHDKVILCGEEAENCTFSLMPSAEVKYYLANPSKGNILRKMNENGEWEEIR